MDFFAVKLPIHAAQALRSTRAPLTCPGVVWGLAPMLYGSIPVS